MQKRVLSLLVDNTAGVTTRVSGLFSRRGYNIDSITGGVTADERFSRITVVCSGDELILEQITNQLAKLVDVRDIKILEPDNSVCHELMMIKVAAKPEQRQGLISIADVFHAKVADVSVYFFSIEFLLAFFYMIPRNRRNVKLWSLNAQSMCLCERLKKWVKKEGCGTKLQSSLHLELFAARLKSVAALLAYVHRASAANETPHK